MKLLRISPHNVPFDGKGLRLIPARGPASCMGERPRHVGEIVHDLDSDEIVIILNDGEVRIPAARFG